MSIPLCRRHQPDAFLVCAADWSSSRLLIYAHRRTTKHVWEMTLIVGEIVDQEIREGRRGRGRLEPSHADANSRGLSFLPLMQDRWIDGKR